MTIGTDRARELAAVKSVMADGRWRTLSEIHEALNFVFSETGISARLRDLRKPAFGSYDVPKRRRTGASNTWEYRFLACGEKPSRRTGEVAEPPIAEGRANKSAKGPKKEKPEQGKFSWPLGPASTQLAQTFTVPLMGGAQVTMSLPIGPKRDHRRVVPL
jgi:hypothetical protein